MCCRRLARSPMVIAAVALVVAAPLWLATTKSAAAQTPDSATTRPADPPIVPPEPVIALTTETPAPAVVVTEATTRRLFGGQKGDPQGSPAAEDDGDPNAVGGGDILNVVVRLAAVAGVIYAAVWLLRRWMRRRGGPTFAGGKVRVLETMGLATNRLLYVIDVGDRLLLLGATPQQLSTLAELTDEETIAALRAGPGGRRTVSFNDHLRDLSARFNLPRGSHESRDSVAEVAAPGPTAADRQAMVARLHGLRDDLLRRRVGWEDGRSPNRLDRVTK